MKKIFFTLILLLASCDNGPNKGADGYTFGQKQYEKETVQINIVTYNSDEELSAIVKTKLRNTNIDPKTVVAFSVLVPSGDVCTIHMVDPSVSYRPEFVGHEFLHCVYGQWHKDNNTF